MSKVSDSGFPLDFVLSERSDSIFSQGFALSELPDSIFSQGFALSELPDSIISQEFALSELFPTVKFNPCGSHSARIWALKVDNALKYFYIYSRNAKKPEFRAKNPKLC